jgi:hypothetical protein
MFSLTAGGFPGAYDSDVIAPVSVGHKQEPAGARYSNRDESLFHNRMIRVWICNR